MLGQLWTDQVTGGAGISSVLAHVCVGCLVTIYPISRQDTVLLGFFSALYSMRMTVSVLASQQLGHWDQAPASLAWKPCLVRQDNRVS